MAGAVRPRREKEKEVFGELKQCELGRWGWICKWMCKKQWQNKVNFYASQIFRGQKMRKEQKILRKTGQWTYKI